MSDNVEIAVSPEATVYGDHNFGFGYVKCGNLHFLRRIDGQYLLKVDTGEQAVSLVFGRETAERFVEIVKNVVEKD